MRGKLKFVRSVGPDLSEKGIPGQRLARYTHWSGSPCKAENLNWIDRLGREVMPPHDYGCDYDLADNIYEAFLHSRCYQGRYGANSRIPALKQFRTGAAARAWLQKMYDRPYVRGRV